MERTSDRDMLFGCWFVAIGYAGTQGESAAAAVVEDMLVVLVGTFMVADLNKRPVRTREARET